VSAASAVASRTFADGRVRTGSFAALLGLVAAANAIGYRHTYPTIADRLAFAHSFGANKAVELFYGVPHDLLTVGGYTAWRLGGLGSVVAGAWGLLAAVRGLRAEEDAGRQELVLAGVVGRRSAYAAVLLAVAAGAALIWLAVFLGLVAGGLAVGGSAYLALATTSPIVVFAGVGALASQLMPDRRGALELASAALALALLLRIVADTSTGLGWLRWGTPLGWVEEMRPFADPTPGVFVLSLALGAALFTAAGWISTRRDVGTGLLRGRDSAPASLRLLSSPWAFALREQRGSFAIWLGSTGIFALIIGLLSTSFTTANLPENLREELAKLGATSLTTPAGALGFYFLLFTLAISLFAISQLAAIRREEAEQQLETLFALPVGRVGWLAGRLGLASAGAVVLAFSAGLLGWIGAASQHAQIPFGRMLEAGANCLPTSLLFLALGALAFALVPRATAVLGYALVVVSFVWQLLGALVGAPRWLLDLTPFQHIAFVPAQPFRTGAAAAMLAVAVVAALISLRTFRRRDLTSA
jgi:ABC-2 type transport system permease protein